MARNSLDSEPFLAASKGSDESLLEEIKIPSSKLRLGDVLRTVWTLVLLTVSILFAIAAVRKTDSSTATGNPAGGFPAPFLRESLRKNFTRNETFGQAPSFETDNAWKELFPGGSAR